MDAAATRAALTEGNFPPTYVPLKTGDYVVVPEVHTDKITAKLQQLKVRQGYLLDSSLPSEGPVDQIAKNSIPDITYLSLKMTVKPISLAIPQLEQGDKNKEGSKPEGGGPKPGGGGGKPQTGSTQSTDANSQKSNK